MRNNFSHKFSQIFCHPLSGSGKKKCWVWWWKMMGWSEKKIIHRSILNLDRLIKSARSQIKWPARCEIFRDLKDPRSNDMPHAKSEFEIPSKNAKSHQSNQRLACYLTKNIPFGINWLIIIDQIWHLSDICSFLPSPSCSFPPPPPFSFFFNLKRPGSEIEETRIPGLKECVGAIIPNPCTLNRTFIGT